MQKIIVLDVETQMAFDEVEGRKPELLKISVAGLYRYDRNEYLTKEENELSELNALLGEAELMVGFNIKPFDYPVLQPYLKIPLQKLHTLDILEDIKNQKGHRVSLNSVAKATLKDAKSGDGLKAIRLYRDGEMDALKKYCLDDVKLTKEIYDYGVKHGKIHYLSKDGSQVLDLSVNWSNLSQDKNEELQLF